jgi:hypothetical protein
MAHAGVVGRREGVAEDQGVGCPEKQIENDIEKEDCPPNCQPVPD